MEPIRLEIFLDDRTRAGMQSAERNITGLETQMQEVISILKKELTGLQSAFKDALSTGVSSPSDLADIQALKGKIVELEEELKSLKRQAEVPVKPNIDLSGYITEEIRAMESAGERVKAIIINIQKDIDALRQKSLESAAAGVVNPEDTAKIKALEAQVRSLTETLVRYEVAKQDSNDTPIMQYDPAPKLNNVKMSMQQIARELPALAMGPQMFFLAISNNIPMFTDAVASARKEYELMTAAGQKATPIWKQLLTSLFSWQTAMATAITLSVVYGKEIGEWVKGLFGGKTALDELRESIQKTYEVEKEANSTLLKTRFELDQVVKSIKNFKGSKDEERKKVTELNSTYGEAFGYYQTLSEWYDTLMQKSSDYIQVLVLEQKARKWIDQAVEEGDKGDKIKSEGVEKNRPWFGSGGKIATFFGGSTTNQFGSDPAVVAYNKKLKEVYDAEEDALKRAEEFQDEVKRIREGTNIKSIIVGSVEELENSIAERRKALKKLTNKADYDVALKVIKEEEKKLEAITGKKDQGGSGKTVTDYQNELSDARVRTQQKLEAARIAVMNDGYLKRKELANKEYQETLAAIDKEERDTLKKMEIAKNKGVKVTPEQEQQVKTSAEQQRALARVQYAKEYVAADTEWMTKGTQAWIDYNKQYGTYQQKRFAIAQEYAIKIAKAENNFDKEALKKEMDESIRSLDFNKLKKDINWETIFGNLGSLTRKQLLDVKKQLVTFKNSPEFKQQAGPEQLKVIEDALSNINASLVDKSGFFGGLGDAMNDYKEKVKAVTQAQKELNEALESGDQAAVEKAQQNLNQAEANRQNSKGNVDKSTDKAVKNLNAVGAAMKQLSGADVSLSDVGGAVENLVSVLGESKSKIGGIIAAILSILDTIGDKGITDFVTDLVSNVLSSLRDAAIKDIEKTSFGLLDMSFFKGADYSDYNEMVEQYKAMNEIWDELLDKKTEYIKMSYNEEAVKAGKEAEELVNKSIASYRTLGKERLNSGASTGSHSIGIRQRKDMSKNEWNEAKAALGSAFYDFDIGEGRMTGLFDLSIEQLEKLKEEAPTFWAKLDDDVRDYLNNIIDGSEKLEEIQQQVREQLTQVSFDSLRSGFLDALMDMDSSAEDFADNFTEYMQRAILNTMLAKTYEDRLQAWYQSFADANSDEAGITGDDYKKLKDEWDKIVSDALGDRDALKNIFGWTGDENGSSQSGRSGAYTTMSQEQGTKLEGLFISLQDHASGMHQLLEELKQGRDADHDLFVQIAENTAYCKLLEDILEIITRQERDGVKIKG